MRAKGAKASSFSGKEVEWIQTPDLNPFRFPDEFSVAIDVTNVLFGFDDAEAALERSGSYERGRDRKFSVRPNKAVSAE
jgi:hypothetical protein